MVFAWLTVNGDCHAKNISVLEKEDEFEIAPAYDLPSSAFYNLDTNMSLSVMGHRNGISGKIWLHFAEELGLRRPYAERIMRNVLTATEGLDEQIASGFLSFDSQTCKRAAREMKNRRRLTLEGWPAFG
jgi:serine/threonine-protein kinase HipA